MTTNWNASSLLNWVPADLTMGLDEAALWERLAQSRRAPVEPSWLGEVYSPGLSVDLKHALCEKLGMQAERGWPVIHQLIEINGCQPELILAAGLCHQPQARDWLLSQWTASSNESPYALCIVQALSCWGADVPQALVTSCLDHRSQQHRLAGLQLLTFRAHLLTDTDLLTLCEQALTDFRDPVAIAAIKVLQRRDGTLIAERLSSICHTGSDAVSKAALLALGCMATPVSQRMLLELSQTLVNTDRQQEACKQLNQQFRN